MNFYFHNNRTCSFILLALGIFLNAMPAASAQPSLIERIQKSEESIVTIEARKINEEEPPSTDVTLTSNGHMVVKVPNGTTVLQQSGAGVIIDPSGYIVTNPHIILYAQFISVTLNDGKQLPASIVSIAPDSDFTILKIDPPHALKALAWADSQNVQLGDPIVCVGNSSLWKQTLSGGTIKGIGRPRSGEGEMIEILEMDLNLDHGDSGGPVLDRNGNFLGIVVAKNMRVKRSSFAIPSNKIREHFLKHQK